MTHRVYFIGGCIAVVGVVGWVGCGTGKNIDQSSPSSSTRAVSSTARQAPRCDVLQGGAVNTGKLPAQCVKIEGGQIGQQGIKVTVNGIEMTFSSWTPKNGEKREFVGFTYVSSDPVCVSIKAGTARFVAEEQGSWIHPAGTTGPKAKGISNVVICVPDEPADDGEDDCPCGSRTCGPDPVCGLSCGTCPGGQICTPMAFCAIFEPH